MMPRPSIARPDYLARVLETLRTHPLRRGDVVHVLVVHDEGCTAPSGAPCTCHPDITLDRGRRS